MSCDGISGMCIAGERCGQSMKARLDVRDEQTIAGHAIGDCISRGSS